MKSSYENLQRGVRKMKTPTIEAWENQYPDRKYEIEIKEPEFTCICPKTGLPDFAAITIRYSPVKYCVELKSFKYYVYSFRNVGIFHEHVINRMLDDFIRAVRPRWAEIEGVFNPRGGITTIVRRSYGRKA